MRLIIEGLDKRTTEAFLKHKSENAQPAVVSFGVLQAAKVDRHARGRDIKGDLLLNYRGPFTLKIDTEEAIEVPGVLEQTVEHDASGIDGRLDSIERMVAEIGKLVGAKAPAARVKRKPIGTKVTKKQPKKGKGVVKAVRKVKSGKKLGKTKKQKALPPVSGHDRIGPFDDIPGDDRLD